MSAVVDKLTANIRGRVQGVSFRYYTRLEARKLEIHGWVRNESDGSVRVEAEGEREKLESLLSFLHHGPSGALVQDVETHWRQEFSEFNDFEIRYL
ncbi:MAG: acylphosphatase [Candidatus Promineifilaceae bacterium]|jgi:acylphosphatase